MDVSVKVSLQGGHQWEFVAEAGSPMVTGLVSALPGATVDASLPPDGLIQLEAKSGERLFVTRSSLVAVSITELDSQGRHSAFAKPTFAGASSPAPFVLVSNFFTPGTLANLQAAISMANSSPIAANVREFSLDRLPIDAERALIRAIDDALTAFGIETNDADRHLNLRALQANDSSAVGLNVRGSIVSLVALLPLTKSAKVFGSINLRDQIADGALAEGVRQVSLESNNLLIYPTAVGNDALHVMSDNAVILEGVLCGGGAVGSE
ncbi:hypothetical protein ABUE31_11220 [Mesorhizobium sp. ZMM04-5]|uniref:Uncharacterized protein n=1 Tax=Mesorhizobium marinum TaxID=3228790 RepID=A0ABV3R1A2_9HYPH